MDVSALQGRDKAAQGNALGRNNTFVRTLNGRHTHQPRSTSGALSGRRRLGGPFSQGVALGLIVWAFQAHWKVVISRRLCPIILAFSLALAVSSYAQTPEASSELPFDETSKADLNNYRVRLVTSFGDIEIDLFPHFAQGHVRNFLNLSKLGLYGGTAWHRIVPGFVIQGGAIDTRVPPVSPQDRVRFVRRLKPEFNRLQHEEGTVSMARATAEDSAETSFFICLGRQKSLDEKYTIFGKVLSGMDVVKKIATVPLGKNDQPKKRIEILRADVIEVKP